MSLIPTRHGAMSYLMVGSGQPLVLIHGNTMTAETQVRLAQRFADAYMVYSIDLLGHGHSAMPDGLFSTNYFIWQGEALADLLDGLFRDDPVPVFGMSAGGISAMNAYCENPDCIAALILDGVFTKIGAATLAAHRQRRAEMGVAWTRYMQAQHGEERWPRLINGILAAMEQLHASGQPVIPCLSEIRAPTLIFHGGKDPYCPTDQCHTVAETIPTARLINNPEAGHIYAWQEQDRFLEIARAFLHEVL